MNKKYFIILLVTVFGLVIFFLSFIFNGGYGQNSSDTEPEDHNIDSYVYSILPITDTNGPFTIKYVTTKDDVDFIRVTDSSPQGRVNALHWLRQNGVDPTDIDINFEDFTNPLNEKINGPINVSGD